MFIKTYRVSRIKLAAMLLLSAVLVAILVVFIPRYPVISVAATDGTRVYTGVKTNEDRIAFLGRFGWKVESEPCETVNVTVPEVFDSIFEGYNELQKAQGLDLTRYKKKTVTRYTYTVTNYPDYDGEVVATLLVYRGRVIGGDLCSTDPEGFIHGFSKPIENNGDMGDK